MADLWKYAAALIPFLGAAFMFYVIIKSVIESDRRERIAQAEWDAAHKSATEETTR